MSNFKEYGSRAYSYETCIKDVLPDGRTVGNVTKYSVTTSKHQNKADVRNCHILLDNVPQGTTNLANFHFQQVRGSNHCDDRLCPCHEE